MDSAREYRHLDPGAGLTEQVVTLSDARRIRTVVAGDDPGPLVVFEAGLSAPAACWIHTQREISAHARTLSYDRAGYGGSDIDPRPRTLERLSDDLAALLDAIGETAPVVLVGHSWGGPIIRRFADQHPERVAGLVFIDASLVEGMPLSSARTAPVLFRVLTGLARVGGSGIVRRMTIPHGFSPEISDDDVTIMLRDYACAQAMHAGRREAQQIVRALPLMERLQADGTPDVPTVCVQGGRIDRGMATLRPALNQAATDLMAAASDGSVVVVADAGHLVPQESPAAVRDVLIDVLHKVKA